MTTTPAPVPIEQLLAHRAWVRALARSLVFDESRADDLEQETWLRALGASRRPTGTAPLRNWLARVVRNAWIDGLRADRQRGLRELAAARPEASRPTDVVAQMDAHRRVVQTAYELDEPCRTTLLLRYFEGLPVREVAARTGVPVETAKTRLRRALERLRARLDEDGGRDAWCAALAPIALATGGATVKTSTKAAIAVAVLLAFGGAGAWWYGSRADRGASSDDVHVASANAADAQRTRRRGDDAAKRGPSNPFPGTATLVGEVRTRADARVAPGATVTLEDRANDRRATAVADENGRFEFRSIAAGTTFHISAESNDAAAVARPVPPLGDREARGFGVLWLDAYGDVEVAVETTTGSPEGASVEVYTSWTSQWGAMDLWSQEETRRNGGFPNAAGRTDAAGRVRLRVPQGTTSVVARKEGFVPAARQWLKVGAGGTTHVGLMLERGVSLEGRLLDAQRRPLAGRRVVAKTGNEVFDASGFATFAATETGDDGRFALRDLRAGPVTLHLRSEAGVVEFATVRAPCVGVVDFVLESRAIEGVVRTVEEGRPVPAAIVRAAAGSSVLQTQADDEGRYRLEGLGAAYFRNVHAEAAGYASADAGRTNDAINLGAGETKQVDLLVTRAATVWGVVTTADSSVAGALVQAYWKKTEDGSIARRDSTTDAAGRYEFANVPGGRVVVVQVNAAGLTQDQWDQNFVSVAMGMTQGSPAWTVRADAKAPARLDITMVGGRTVAGRVLDETSSPVACAQVSAGLERTTCRDDGTFVIRGVPAAAGTPVNAWADGFGSAQVKVERDRDVPDLKIVLHPGTRVHGTVHLEGGGSAPEGAVVRWTSVEALQWYSDEATMWRMAAPVRVRADGTFATATSFATGTLRVRAEASGFEQVPVEVVLTADKKDYDVALVLVPAAVVTGQVVDDATGASVAAATIALDIAGEPRAGAPYRQSKPISAAVADADGRFIVPDLPWGRYPGAVTAAGFLRRSFELVVPSSGPVVVRLTASAVLCSGVVRGPDGKPVADASVTAHQEPLRSSNDETPGVGTGADGRFELRGAAGAKAWTVMVYPPQGRGFPNRWVRMENVAAGRTDLEFVLGRAQRIAGSVLGSDGKPVCGTSVRATCPDPRAAQPNVRTDDAGRFVLEGLDDRAYDVVADAPSERRDDVWVSVCHDIPTTARGVAAGKGDLTIRLDAGETIAGKLAGDDGRALFGAWLIASPVEGQQDMGSRRPGHFPCGGPTDIEGCFSIGGLERGHYQITRVELDHVGGEPLFTPLVGGEDVMSGSDAVRLRIASLGEIAGRAVDEDGKGVAGLWIWAMAGNARVRFTRTDADGAFRLLRLDISSSPILKVEMPGVIVPAKTEAIRPGTMDVLVKVRRGLRATGRVVDPEGKPPGGACSLKFVSDSGGSWFHFRTNADGRFDVAGLIEGTYRVEASAVQTASGRDLHGTATIRAGDRDVELRFGE